MYRRMSIPIILLVLHVFALENGEARTIEFAGCEWRVKTGSGGPGPNQWSDSEKSVWVDEDGLHLRIRKEGDIWFCAEVTTVEPTRYGMHRFYVCSRVDQLDKNVIASPFLYASDTKEIDIEFATWGKDNPEEADGQYVIQPHSHRGNLHRFPLNLNGDASTHSFDWSETGIEFLSVRGHHGSRPVRDDAIIREWAYTGEDNPGEADGLRVHINLWLMRGLAPSDGKEAELIIKDADLPISRK